MCPGKDSETIWDDPKFIPQTDPWHIDNLQETNKQTKTSKPWEWGKSAFHCYYIIRLKCPAFNYQKKKKIRSQTKTQKTMAHSNKSKEIVPEKDLLADPVYKDNKTLP